MSERSWVKELAGAITVCDTEGTILEMNDKAREMFSKQGGSRLIGSNVLDCHPEPAKAKLKSLLEERRENVYTTEKNGLKKLICQMPWYRDGEFSGIVEVSLEIPKNMPHFLRSDS